MHALIVGARGVGKSTLIRRVIEELNRPVFGFETKKEDFLAVPKKGSPIYIYDAGKEHVQTDENLVGYCQDHHAASLSHAFNRYAAKLMAPVPKQALIELDEIGFLEASATDFCSAILHLLDGSTPILAAVKDKELPFLDRVRAHPNVRCFYITPENRDQLYEEVLAFLKIQLEESVCQEKH